MKTRFRRTRRSGDNPVIVSVHEHLPADADSTLVRVAGTWDGPGTCPLHEAVLVLGASQSFDPLPAPPPADGDRSWRLAYAVPSALLRGFEVDEFLRAADGTIVELPDATRRALAPQRDGGATGRVLASQRDDGATLPPAADPEPCAESAELREAIAAREEDLQRAMAEAERLRRREAMLREGLDEITAGLAEWREKTEAECDRLKAEIAARDGSLAETRAAAEMAERQAAELHTELDRAHEQLRQLRAQLAAVSARRSSAETDVDVTRAELDELTARAAAAEADAASQAGRLAALEAELRDSRALLVEARDRRDEPAPESDALAAAEQRARDAEERIRVLEAHAAEAERLRAKLERGSNARRPLFVKRRSGGDSELTDQLAAAQRQNADLERQVAGLAEQMRTSDEQQESEAERMRGVIAELEHQLDKQRQVEEDLRELLDSERRQAAEARLVADGLRLRLADLPADDLPAPAPPPEEARTSWSAMDEELLGRLERAKAASGA